MSADDPTSAEYANQQELNRLNKIVEESQAAAEAEIAQAKADSEAAAAAINEEQQAAIAGTFSAHVEANAPAKEALQALQAGEPIQDGELPPPPEVVATPPRPEQWQQEQQSE